MENVSIRAITIGVAVFISIATISAVLTYYNSAKDMVRQVGSGTDFLAEYEQGMRETLSKSFVDGIEVKNIINYFSYKNDVTVKLENCSLFEENNTATDYNKESINVSNSNRNNILRRVIPNYSYKISLNNNTITIKDK